MTKKNERMNVIRDNFFETYRQENREIPENCKTVWKTMIRKAGDDFLYMNEEGMQRFLVTVVAREELSYFTRYNYFLAYRTILAFMKEGGNITVVCNDWEFKTIFCYNSRNEDNKTDNSDNSLNEHIAELEESIDSIEQEIDKHRQEKEKHGQEEEKHRQEKEKHGQEEEKHRQEKEKHGQEEERLSEQLLAKIAELDNIKYSQKRHKKFLNH